MSVDDPELPLRFRARPPDRPGWWVRALGLAGGTAAVVLGVVLVVVGRTLPGAVVASLSLVGTVLVYRTGRPRSFAVTDAGIVSGGRLYRWDRLVAYEVDGSAVVVHADVGFDDVRIDRDDVAESRRLLAILSERLPEADGDPD